MGRKPLHLLSLALLLLLSGCSTREDFVVLNRSGEVVELRYKIKRCTGDMSGDNSETHQPHKLTVKEFQKSDRAWNRVSKADYKYDARDCSYTVKVAPDEATLVDYAYNYRGPDSEGSELHFEVEALSIKGAKGEILLEGRQAQTQFKLESGAYVITYE